MANPSSRREVLTASALLAASLAGCGGGGGEPRAETVSAAQMQSDAAVLGNLLDLERSAVVAYATLAAQLSGRARSTARLFGRHEQAHAAALSRAMGGFAVVPPPGRSAAEYRAAFPPLRDAREALSFALDVETTAISAYADAFAKVVTGSVRITLAQIMATESEHAAVLLGRLGRPQVPDAFVTGPPPSIG